MHIGQVLFLLRFEDNCEVELRVLRIITGWFICVGSASSNGGWAARSTDQNPVGHNCTRFFSTPCLNASGG